MNPAVCSTESNIVFFPVRHHSPQAAIQVERLIDRLKPGYVFVEGPSDFNSSIDELYLNHKLPVAIYSYAELPDGRRSGAFYPFCVYSPEWQAIQAGKSCNATVQFIDMPWSELARKAVSFNRFADGQMADSGYIRRLCKRFGVEDFHALWDRIAETERDLEADEYLKRCHHLCYHMRAADGASSEDIAREEFMARFISSAAADGGGKILVVTGGFHSYALWLRLSGAQMPEYKTFTTPGATLLGQEMLREDGMLEDGMLDDGALEESDPDSPDEDDRQIVEHRKATLGVSLTPYSYERLDSLEGYDAGMTGPGFYHKVYEDRLAGRRDSWRVLLSEAVAALRKKKQIVSAADIIAVESSARALAAVRGHAEVWRQDLVDGIISALVKDELSGAQHPLLAAIHASLRGDCKGKLAPGTRLPHLALEIQKVLGERNLEPDSKERYVELDLKADSERITSAILHRLVTLKIPGFILTESPDPYEYGDELRLTESWRIVWSPDLDAGCIEASVHGATLEDAATNCLLERSRRLKQSDEGGADRAATLAREATLMRLPQVSMKLWQQLDEIVDTEADIFRLGDALGQIVFLEAYEDVIDSASGEFTRRLVEKIFLRAVWLLESHESQGKNDPRWIKLLRLLLSTCERNSFRKAPTGEDFLRVLEKTAGNTNRNPQLRGAALGALWTMGRPGGSELVEALQFFKAPETLGDFLTGLFSLGREIARYKPELMQSVDQLLTSYSEDEYLKALPHLRLAFSLFTPAERHHMASALFSAEISTHSHNPQNEEISSVADFDRRLNQRLSYFNLRGAT